MNSTDPPTVLAPGTRSRRCRCCIALILALLILGPLAVYPPVRNYLRLRHGAELIQQLKAPNADIPGLLKEVDGLDRDIQGMVLEAARHEIISYFAASAEAAIDESKMSCDYDGALHIIFNASLYYPDSAELSQETNSIRARKAQASSKTGAECKK